MNEDLKNKIEALLFSAARLITIEEIEEVIGIHDKEGIKNAVKELQERHTDSSLVIIEEKGGYRFTIKEKYIDIVSKVVENTELNKPVMETLAVIAWKAPVLQSEIIKIRSNKAYDHIGELKDADFIIKEKLGRSYKIKLAPKFYEYFDIRNKDDIKEKFAEVEKKAEEEQTIKMEEMYEKQQQKEEKSVEEALEEIRKEVQKTKKEVEKKVEQVLKEEKLKKIEDKKDEEAETENEDIEERIEEIEKKETDDDVSNLETSEEIEKPEEVDEDETNEEDKESIQEKK